MTPRRLLPWVGLALLIAAVGLAIAQFIGPAPPRDVVIAGGSPGGAYAMAAEELAQALRQVGVEADVVATAGSAENLARLQAGDETRVDIALVQSGLGQTADGVQSLGALFPEPIWLFARRANTGPDMQALSGLTVAAGAPGSGARALAETLWRDNAVDPASMTLLPLSGQEAVAALREGRADAAFVVASPRATWVQNLAADPALALIPFDRAPGYERRLPYLTATTLRRGALNPATDTPRQDIPMLAASAQLAVRADLHPAIQSVLLDAAHDRFSSGDVLTAPGVFPNRHAVDLPLSEEAARYYQNGPTTLRRYLPYWAANLVQRAWMVLLPLAVLISPLARSAPPVYRWRTRRKIYTWYRDLRDLEVRGRAAQDEMERAHVRTGLAALEHEVSRIAVPEAYTDELFRLREHIAFVAQRIVANPS
jgi:TRAP transporter TAXI family solute receptor